MGAGWQERRWGRHGSGGLGPPGNKGGGRGPGGAGGKGSGQRRGRGRGGGNSPANPVPVWEVLTIPSGHGSEFFVITDINGIDLGDFSFISIRMDDVDITGAATGVNMQMQLSADGGSTWLTGYRTQAIDAGGAAHGASTSPRVHEGAGSYFLSQWIQDFGSETPTTVQTQENKLGDVGPKRRNFITTTAEKHNALRFRIIADSTPPVFFRGTIEIVGYRTPAADVQIIDCAVTQATEYFVNIPAGHTIANVYAINCAATTKDRIRVRASVSGTPVSGASDYRSFLLSHTLSTVFEDSNFNFCANQENSQYGHVSLWNLNTVAPLMCSTEWQSVNPTIPTDIRILQGTLKVVAAYSQIQIFKLTGTMNSGKIYIQTYAPNTTVLSATDFGAANASSVDITGLTDVNASAVLLGTTGLVSASSDFTRVAVIKDSVNEKGGSFAYVRAAISEGGDSVSSSTSGFGCINPSTTTAPFGSSLLVGMPQGVATNMVHSHDAPVGTGLFCQQTHRDAPQIEEGLHFYNFNDNNFTSGVLYAVGYGL